MTSKANYRDNQQAFVCWLCSCSPEFSGGEVRHFRCRPKKSRRRSSVEPSVVCKPAATDKVLKHASASTRASPFIFLWQRADTRTSGLLGAQMGRNSLIGEHRVVRTSRWGIAAANISLFCGWLAGRSQWRSFANRAKGRIGEFGIASKRTTRCTALAARSLFSCLQFQVPQQRAANREQRGSSSRTQKLEKGRQRQPTVFSSYKRTHYSGCCRNRNGDGGGRLWRTNFSTVLSCRDVGCGMVWDGERRRVAQTGEGE